MLHIVLLSGGSGSRLWPLSNSTRSKQFLKVLRDADGNPISMVQRVFNQLSSLDFDFDITIATSSDQVASIEMQVSNGYALVIEPERRDTAPAIMLACANLKFEQGADPHDSVIVLPIDTYADDDYYYAAISELDEALRFSDCDIVLLGVRPTYPSEKFGYIIPLEPEKPFSDVKQFKEKPTVEEAVELISRGSLWNCGVFAFKLQYVLEKMREYVELDEYDQAIEKYSQLPKNSFDYEIVENADCIGVVPYLGAWKDLGTWNTLTEEMEDKYAGRAVVDTETCENVHVINETMLPMIVSGVRDSVIIATHDGILVSGKEASSSSRLKKLISQVSALRPMYERRLWGEYRVLDIGTYDGVHSLTKELVIKQGEQLSYQRHLSRSEVWTIVCGHGEVVLDGVTREVFVGDTVNVKIGMLHSIRAFEELHIIEVQLGKVLTEEDIERFGYFWNYEVD